MRDFPCFFFLIARCLLKNIYIYIYNSRFIVLMLLCETQSLYPCVLFYSKRFGLFLLCAPALLQFAHEPKVDIKTRAVIFSFFWTVFFPARIPHSCFSSREVCSSFFFFFFFEYQPVFLVPYFAVFLATHNENSRLYSFGMKWVRDRLNWQWDTIRRCDEEKWTLPHEHGDFLEKSRLTL